MAEFSVKFDIAEQPVRVPYGTLVSEAARMAGIEIAQPCGGQGRCGRCTVQIMEGNVRRRSTLRLSDVDISDGFALACQTVIDGDAYIVVPPQEIIERRLVTDKTIGEIKVPEYYEYAIHQSLQRFCVDLDPPSLEDQTDDLNRLKTTLRQQTGISFLNIPVAQLRMIGETLRAGDWKVTTYIDRHINYETGEEENWLVDIIPGHIPEYDPIWGLAIDIGTTTVTVWLVDLIRGNVVSQNSQYNGQIARGEDVISRIIYTNKDGGLSEMKSLVVETINGLIQRACERVKEWDITPSSIYRATIAGNSTMIHLLLAIPAASIRLEPYITALNQVPLLRGDDLGIDINPFGVVECLPGVASYVGADISAGVYSSGMADTELLTLFMDVGTNGEIVLGSREWLVTCACSAGPAFEGAGVVNGMRATTGAIEEIWINSDTFEPSYRVIGNIKPRGICGSGLISLLAELFITGVIDKGGNINLNLPTERVRDGENGAEYVIAWGIETRDLKDIVISHVDIDNLLRAKAAIYAGISVLAQSVGVPLEEVEQMLIGGSFGKYINIEKAIQIGLLPDLPWEKFKFLGNTSVLGTYFALLDRNAHQRITEIASRMTYIELSADNSFFNEFTSALFLPHTDMSKFPTVEKIIGLKRLSTD